MEPLDSQWEIKLEYKKKLQLEDAKFIFEQAEKSFDDSIETSKKILERSFSLLTLLSGVLIGLVAYSIDKWDKTHLIDDMMVTTIFAILYYLTIGLWLIFPNIRPTQYVLPGTQPKRYFNDQLFNANPPQGRLALLYMIEIKNLQEGITENEKVNVRRWSLYKKALSLVFYSPVVFAITYLLISVFS